MNGKVVFDMVYDFDQYCIIFPGIKSGSWELPIYCDNGFA